MNIYWAIVSGKVIGAQTTIGLLNEFKFGICPFIIFDPTYLRTFNTAYALPLSLTTPIFMPPYVISSEKI